LALSRFSDNDGLHAIDGVLLSVVHAFAGIHAIAGVHDFAARQLKATFFSYSKSRSAKVRIAIGRMK
jgi:hypothetical protein